MAKLKPWYQLVNPREDLRAGNPLDASEFAVHLDHIRTGRVGVSKDYSDPVRFFERTYLTRGLLDLASQMLRRLNGVQFETSAVFNLATEFGAGKTHALTTLFYLARHGEVAKSWRGVDSILVKAQVTAIPRAHTAVFIGTEFDALTGRKGVGEPVRRTPWGEIAWQLGGETSFAVVAQHDFQQVAPAGDVLREMLPPGPTLILVDELLNYLSSSRPLGLRDQFFNFLQNLCEEARVRNNVLLCVSLPRSDLEMNPDDRRDYDAIKKLCDRVGRAVAVSADRELNEIVRRRLFDWDGLPADALPVISAYATYAAEHSAELAGVDRESVYEVFKSCYPFHPVALSVFERKWMTSPSYQRTRGVLRLFALWVSHLCRHSSQIASNEPLISLGLAPLDDHLFRAAVFEQLGSSDLMNSVMTDIIGTSDSHCMRLDTGATAAIKKSQLHRKVGTTIFFESAGGRCGDNAHASISEIRTSVFYPGCNLNDVDTVLESLVSNCFYLKWERNLYQLGVESNLNQRVAQRRGGVSVAAIDGRIRERTEALFRQNSCDAAKRVDRVYFPRRSNDVYEQPSITLVVLDLDFRAENQSTLSLINSIIRGHGANGRTMKSALFFAVADGAEDVHSMARDALAWEEVDHDAAANPRFNGGQLELLGRNLKSSRLGLDEAIRRAYRHLYWLGKDNTLRHLDMGGITAVSTASLVEIFLQKLGSESGLDEIVDSFPARKLIEFWPESRVEWATISVRDMFFSSPLLPRLLHAEIVKQTIAVAVAQGLISYAIKDSGGQLKHRTFAKSQIQGGEIEISNNTFILKRASDVRLQESVSEQFLNADARAVATPPSEAVEPAGDATRVPDSAEFVDSTPPSPTVLEWHGQVPPQKWMTFYTKVLSRLIASPEFEIDVTFRATVDPAHKASVLADAQSSLRALGLSEDVRSA